MLMLSLVSGKNVIITATLVSIFFTLHVATLPYRPKVHNYRSAVRYVCWSGTGETVAHLPPSNHSRKHRCVARLPE